MKYENVPDLVSKRIEELTAAKNQQLAEIKMKIKDATNEAEKAAEAAKAANENLNLVAFADAKAAESRAKMALEMCIARRETISRKKTISEEESDKVIDSLLQYEEELAAEYKAAVYKLADDLKEKTEEYLQKVEQTENVIIRWTANIHANYRAQGSCYGPEMSNRAPKPVPVHRVAYTGCPESAKVKIFVDLLNAK